MPHAVPELCALIFELRIGVSLRDAGSEATAPSVVDSLQRGLEADLDAEALRATAGAIVGRVPAPAWTRADLELPPPGDDDGEEEDEGTRGTPRRGR